MANICLPASSQLLSSLPHKVQFSAARYTAVGAEERERNFSLVKKENGRRKGKKKDREKIICSGF
jgi:hypothetical protein